VIRLIKKLIGLVLIVGAILFLTGTSLSEAWGLISGILVDTGFLQINELGETYIPQDAISRVFRYLMLFVDI